MDTKQTYYLQRFISKGLSKYFEIKKVRDSIRKKNNYRNSQLNKS